MGEEKTDLSKLKEQLRALKAENKALKKQLKGSKTNHFTLQDSDKEKGPLLSSPFVHAYTSSIKGEIILNKKKQVESYSSEIEHIFCSNSKKNIQNKIKNSVKSLFTKLKEKGKQCSIIEEIEIDRKKKYFEFILVPIPIEKAENASFQILIRDLDALLEYNNKIIEDQANYKSFIDRMNEGIIVVNFEGVIIFVNPKFCEFVKKKKEELIGKFAFKELNILNFTVNEMLQKVQSRKGYKKDSYELQMKLDDGSLKWFKVSAAPLLNSKNESIGSIGIHMDITNTLTVEQQNKQLLNVIDNSSDFVIITNGLGETTYTNDAFRKFTGLKKNNSLNRRELIKFITEDSQQKLLNEAVPSVFKENKWIGEILLESNAGDKVPFSLLLWTQKDVEDNFEYFACIARNISAQKYTQRELSILTRIPDENPFPVLRISEKGVLEYANKPCDPLLKKWEVERGNLMPEIWRRVIQKAFKDNKNKEFELTAGNKIFELLISPITEYGYVNVFGNDITTKKIAGIELKSSERRYRAVVEDQTEFISRFLPNGTITFANRAYCEYFGLERKNIIGKNLFSNITRSKLKEFKKRLSKLSFENPVTTYDERIDLPDGNSRWQLWTDRAIYDENGKFIEFQSVGQDITRVKLAEEAIRQQRKYLRDIIDANPNAIYVRDENGTTQMINKAGAELFKAQLKDLVGVNLEKQEWANESAYKTLFEFDQKTLVNDNVQVLPEIMITSGRKKRWYQTIKTPISSPSGAEKQVLSVSTDISDRKMVEEELKHQLDLKELIATLSAQFINLHWSEIDTTLEESLAILGKFTGLDRVIITVDQESKAKVEQFWSRQNPKKWMEVKKAYEQLYIPDMDWVLNPILEEGYFLVEDVKERIKTRPKNYELLDKGNVKSILILPMYSKGKAEAFLSFVSTRKKKEWSPDTIALFRILTQVFSSALERRNTEYMLNRRMDLEMLITHISSQFVNIGSSEINNEINVALEKVARFLKVDYAFVLVSESENKTFALSNYWAAKNSRGINAEYLKNIPSKNHHWEYKQLKYRELLSIKSVNEIPAQANDLRAIMDLMDVSSLLVVPISYEDVFYGALGFSSHKAGQFWDNDILPLMKILGQVFANALERKKAEDSLIEQEQIYRTLAKNIPNSTVFIYDKKLNYKLAEGVGLSKSGFKKEEIEGKNIYEVLPNKTAGEMIFNYKKALKGEEHTIEKQIGSTFYLMHFLPIRNKNGEIYLGMVVAIDISNLKSIQKELENQTKELKRSNEDLEQFAYAASHDLQEPLRMVSSYVHLIKRRIGEHLEGEIKEFMDFATDGAARMQDLINDLLEYSRVDRSGRDFEPVDLQKLMQLQETMLHNTIQKSGAKIKYENLPTVKGDKSQLQSLFQNLIENAIKFRGDKAPVVEIGSKKYKNHYNIWVKDNGIGIDERFFERIFVIFQRLNNRTTYTGTGIGLAICKKIVERHGGEIWVESNPGEGSTFYFDLRK